MLVAKLIRVGNSVAVSVPAAYRRRLNWHKGQHIAIAMSEVKPGQPGELRIWSVERGIEETEANVTAVRIRGTRIPSN